MKKLILSAVIASVISSPIMAGNWKVETSKAGYVVAYSHYAKAPVSETFTQISVSEESIVFFSDGENVNNYCGDDYESKKEFTGQAMDVNGTLVKFDVSCQAVDRLAYLPMTSKGKKFVRSEILKGGVLTVHGTDHKVSGLAEALSDIKNGTTGIKEAL